MTSKNSTIGILGAGISGLSIAYALQQRGAPVTVYEQDSSVGGVIRSTHKSGWLIEHGPNTMMVRSQRIWDLIHELDLDKRLLEANKESKKRFIVLNERPVPAPMSLFGLLKTDLFSTTAKLRLLKEPFINASQNSDESIAEFFERRLGKEILDYAVNPFVSGIFAGDPRQLSMKHTFSKLRELEQESGSILWGMLKRKKQHLARKALISFVDGLQELPDALSRKLGKSVKKEHKVAGIIRQNNNWVLHFEGGVKKEHNVIVSTLPQPSLRRCMQSSKGKELLARLNAISYAPMSVLHMGFKRDKINHPLDGFGMLIPEKENYDTLGTLFSSTLFHGRAPKGCALLTSFIGGSTKPKLAGKSKEELVSKVQEELDQLLGISGTPDFIQHTYWKRAIPQYEVGYDSCLEIMESIEHQLPGFHICGNIRGGVSVPDCIENGFQKAEKIISQLS